MNAITQEEWIAELERMQHIRPDDNGLTRRELQQVWKCSERIAILRLQELQHAGRLVRGRKRQEGIDGRQSMVPCYGLKPNDQGGQQ